MRRGHTQGFTLIEVLAVIAVFAVAISLSASTFISALSGRQALQARTALHAQAERALDTVAQDFNRLVPARLSGVAVRGEQGWFQDDSRYWRMQLEDDRLILPVEVINPDTALREHATVMYQIDRGQEPAVLVRTYGALDAAVPEGATEQVVQNVHGFRVEFHDGEEWLPRWEEPTMPAAVRVSLTLADPTRLEEQIARTSTFAIHVR